MLPRHIIAVDWGKRAAKRTAYLADVAAKEISRLPFDGSLTHLLDIGDSLAPPVLIGIDAAIGFPLAAWKALRQRLSANTGSFSDFLVSGQVPADFFEPASHPGDWSALRPFISPPKERWSLSAYIEASENGIYRNIDRQLQAKPIFVLNGMPGTVGSGTRALWQEMIQARHAAQFCVWPFEGDLASLLATQMPVIAEIYPKACYGIALAETLPANLLALAKGRLPIRIARLRDLMAAQWLTDSGVKLDGVVQAETNEDDFDALMSAAALLRLALQDFPLDQEEADYHARIEGGVLGATALSLTSPRSRPGRLKPKARSLERSPRMHEEECLPCPIPGCQHVFRGTHRG